MMEKIKNWLSPVKGGHQDGYTFKQHIARWQVWVPLIGFFFFIFYAIPFADYGNTGLWGVDAWQEFPWVYYAMEGGMVAILLLYIFKTLQHWDDLKNHTSR